MLSGCLIFLRTLENRTGEQSGQIPVDSDCTPRISQRTVILKILNPFPNAIHRKNVLWTIHVSYRSNLLPSSSFRVKGVKARMSTCWIALSVRRGCTSAPDSPRYSIYPCGKRDGEIALLIPMPGRKRISVAMSRMARAKKCTSRKGKRRASSLEGVLGGFEPSSGAGERMLQAFWFTFPPGLEPTN
eukprot:394757-Amorphochlora_amoeboformis.AAC.3